MRLPEYKFPVSLKQEISLDHQIQDPQKYVQDVKQLQKKMAWETMRSRGLNGFTQYGVMFSAFWIGGLYRPFEASFFRSGYGALRVYDDVADGDRPVPSGYKSTEEYLKDKRFLIDRVHSGEPGLRGEVYDRLLVDAVTKAKTMGVDLHNEWGNIMDTIIFDEERSRKRRVCSKVELDEYFVKLDSACIDGALKVVGDTREMKMDALETAVRLMFNLRDLPKDIQDGLINIPGEEVEQYDIDLDKFAGTNFRAMDWNERMTLLLTDPGIKSWYRDQLDVGLLSLADADGILQDPHYKRVTRTVLKYLFVNPVVSNFSRMGEILGS